jgi:endonuclease YncB( thermonuclease family)
MPVNHTNRWRRVLLATGALASCGFVGVGSVRAQGLDMDASPNTPAPAAHQSGGLDTDVNPDAPIPSRTTVQAVPRDNVQNGIAPLNPKTAQDLPLAPAAEPSDTPPAPATVVQQPAPLVAEPVNLDHPKVIDTAKLQSGETTVSLYGVEGIAGASAQGLQAFLGAGDGHVTCQAQASAGFVCLTADGTNVAQVALVNGAAKTTPDAPNSYREQEAAAQAARRGIWANLPPPPETLKHPIVQDTSTLFADGKTYVLDGVVGFQAPYSGQLQSYIAANGDSATCAPQNDAGHYVCLMPDGTDVAKVALVNGAARVAQDAPDAYRVQQLDALNNRRGYWATAPEAVMTAALLPPQPNEQYTLVAGDDGVDGITYVGGAPVALIDGQPMFLVYGDNDLGWGYYDHYHHWHGAPDHFRRHMEHFHPGGHGLRGHDGFYHDAGMRGREDAMRHDAGMRGREDVLYGAGARPAMGGRDDVLHGGGARPAMGGREDVLHGSGVRPGMGGAAGHPGNVAMAGGRPGMAAGAPGGGFVHPGAAASAGGFHPGAAPTMHTAASAPRAAAPHPNSGGGGGGAKHK